MRYFILIAALAAPPAFADAIDPRGIATAEGCRQQLRAALAPRSGFAEYTARQAALAPEAVRPEAMRFAELQAQIAELEEKAAQALMRACAAY